MNKILSLIFSMLMCFLCSNAVLAENTAPADIKNQPKKIELKAPIQDTSSQAQSEDVSQNSETLENEIDEQSVKNELTDEQKAITESDAPVVKDVDFSVNSNDELKKDVIPNTGSELEKLVFMFAKVMFSVLLCSVILYFLLLLVKKFFHTENIIKSDESYDIRNLTSPENSDEAMKSFLDNTKER